MQHLARSAEHAGVLGQGHGGVGPPVKGRGFVQRVLDAHVHRQLLCAVREVEVQLVDLPLDGLVLVHPQKFAAVRLLHLAAVKGRAGEHMVTGVAQVPLHAAGEPGVADAQVRDAQGGVLKQQFPAFVLVEQRPQPPAHGGQKGGLQVLVFQHQGGQAHRLVAAGVTVLHAVGEGARAAPHAVTFQVLRAEGAVVGQVQILDRRAKEGLGILGAGQRARQGQLDGRKTHDADAPFV